MELKSDLKVLILLQRHLRGFSHFAGKVVKRKTPHAIGGKVARGLYKREPSSKGFRESLELMDLFFIISLAKFKRTNKCHRTKRNASGLCLKSHNYGVIIQTGFN